MKIIELSNNTDKEKLRFLKMWAIEEGSVTTWHLNDNFLEWASIYYKDKTLGQCRRYLIKYIHILVEERFLKSSRRVGIGYGGGFDFGVNFQTIWEINIPITRELIEELNNS
jgi:hypothetical protein